MLRAAVVSTGIPSPSKIVSVSVAFTSQQSQYQYLSGSVLVVERRYHDRRVAQNRPTEQHVKLVRG